MAWIGAAIAVGGAIIGDVTSSSNQGSANDTNELINQQNIDAAMARQTQAEGFNQQQQQNAQNFSAQQVAQQEAYQTQMSDTSMQRRVADLRAAGLNPLLAVSQGGAQAMPGAAAYGTPVSASPAGQGSGIPMQNTGAAFGGLGGQVSSAISVAQTQAQIDNLKAQTDNLNAKTQGEIPAQIEYLKSMTGLTDQNAKVAANTIDLVKQNVLNASAQMGKTQVDTALQQELTSQAMIKTDVLKATQSALISATQSDATAKALGLQELRNLNAVQQTQLGKDLAYINAVLKPVATAAGAAGNIGLTVP